MCVVGAAPRHSYHLPPLPASANLPWLPPSDQRSPRAHPRDVPLVAHRPEAQGDLVVRELAELPRTRHGVAKAVGAHELHRPWAVKADMVEQGDGIVGARAELPPDGATLALAVRQQAEEVWANHALAEGPVGDGHGERERDATIGLVVAKAHESAPILTERPRGDAGDKDAEVNGGHGYAAPLAITTPCSRAISRTRSE